MPITNNQLKALFGGRVQTAPDETGNILPDSTGEVTVNATDQTAPDTTGITAPVTEGHTNELAPANNDPLKQGIKPRKSKSRLIKLLARLLGVRPKAEPTPEERALIEERKRVRLLEKTLRFEAQEYKKRILQTLDYRDICYRYKKSEHDYSLSRVKPVRFSEVRLTADAIYFHVYTEHLPRGTSISKLVDPDLLRDLSLNCRHRVTADFSELYGMWYIVERASGVLGIPNHVNYYDLLNAFPASADGLSLPIGIGSNGRAVIKSLGSMQSILVGGTTGAGKSNQLNNFICTLIRRNKPSRLKILLFDFKGGLEFHQYRGVPHLCTIEKITDIGIIESRNDAIRALRWLLTEGERRINLIRESGQRDIARYNQHNRLKALSHIVFVIDEYADLKLDHEIGRESEDIITNICQRFRAVGIHAILCTQVPKSEIISTRIKGVLPAKIAFSCPTNQASMAVIDNGDARGLHPVGRAVFQWESEIILQTPYINDRIITETVQGAITGSYESIEVKKHDVTQLEVMEYALKNDNGYLARERLYPVFKPRGMTIAELISWFSDWEGKEFVIGAGLYKVNPPSGQRARRLVAVEEKDEKPNETNPVNASNNA